MAGKSLLGQVKQAGEPGVLPGPGGGEWAGAGREPFCPPAAPARVRYTRLTVELGRTWVAQPVTHLRVAQVMISASWEPVALPAASLAPASPPSLRPALSLSQVNK